MGFRNVKEHVHIVSNPLHCTILQNGKTKNINSLTQTWEEISDHNKINQLVLTVLTGSVQIDGTFELLSSVSSRISSAPGPKISG